MSFTSPPNRTPRALAFALALAVNLLALSAFITHSTFKHARSADGTRMRIVWIATPVARATQLRLASRPAPVPAAPGPALANQAPPSAPEAITFAAAAPPQQGAGSAAGSEAPLRAAIDGATVRAAARASLADAAHTQAKFYSNKRETNKSEQFARDFTYAQIPNCIGPDALRHDAPRIGQVDFTGLAALPFLAHAAITGKCH